MSSPPRRLPTARAPFAQVELLEALNNKGIKSINAIPKEIFQKIYETTGSPEQVNKAVAASSFDRMQGMQVCMDGGKVLAIDTASFIVKPHASAGR